ncbi:methyltransferase domain-containing protein [Clostridium ihumii]|uniref:methyltransferase domain-containing protein n=1 Tax=Clostridium ihumii TaxID=1470356 RepID=UPI0006845601|nr:class I SAM-dependent methyltransferase [Clostridium ihumii]
MDMRLKFNEDVYNYDKARPSYPKEMFLDIINYSNINFKHKALEIGIGTGKATMPILQSGCNVTSIELGNNLAEHVKDKFSNYSNFNVINDDFMKYPFDSESLDFIYSATAFHWLPEEEAFTKIQNILKMNGTIALFWNHPFPNREDDISNIVNRKIYDKYRPTNKKIEEFSKKDCEIYVDKLNKFGFKDVVCKLYHRKRTLTSDEYIELLNTYSDHRALQIDLKNNFERDMKSSIDEVGGKINIYDTIDLYLARKL